MSDSNQRAAYGATHHFAMACKLLEEARGRMERARSFARTARLTLVERRAEAAIESISSILSPPAESCSDGDQTGES